MSNISNDQSIFNSMKEFYFRKENVKIKKEKQLEEYNKGKNKYDSLFTLVALFNLGSVIALYVYLPVGLIMGKELMDLLDKLGCILCVSILPVYIFEKLACKSLYKLKEFMKKASQNIKEYDLEMEKIDESILQLDKELVSEGIDLSVLKTRYDELSNTYEELLKNENDNNEQIEITSQLLSGYQNRIETINNGLEEIPSETLEEDFIPEMIEANNDVKEDKPLVRSLVLK